MVTVVQSMGHLLNEGPTVVSSCTVCVCVCVCLWGYRYILRGTQGRKWSCSSLRLFQVCVCVSCGCATRRVGNKANLLSFLHVQVYVNVLWVYRYIKIQLEQEVASSALNNQLSHGPPWPPQVTQLWGTQEEGVCLKRWYQWGKTSSNWRRTDGCLRIYEKLNTGSCGLDFLDGRIHLH